MVTVKICDRLEQKSSCCGNEARNISGVVVVGVNISGLWDVNRRSLGGTGPVEMWWHKRRNQISSFGETDESI